LALNIYLDASAIIPLFVADAFTARARTFLSTKSPILVVSDFAAVEFASVVARLVRMKHLTLGEARSVFSSFDIWIAKIAYRVETRPVDIRAAETMLRRLDLALRAPDALNIAIAQRTGSVLATFDEKMSACARKLGAAVSAI
jgi:uncharacterized protein